MRNAAKRTISLLLVFILAAGLIACGNSSNASTKRQFEIWDCFDTVISVISYNRSEKDFEQLKTETKSAFEEYNRLFDIYNDYDGICNIKTVNDMAGKSPVAVDKEIIAILEYAISMYEKTDGYVNVAMGSVLKLWHEARELADDPEKAFVPSEKQLENAALHCNIYDIEIDKEKGTVFLRDPEMSLDLGSIAKGFASEMVSKKLNELGFDSFLISAGSSSIKTSGKKPDGSDWITAIETDPDLDYIYLDGYSISTSGNYQRYFIYDGNEYHHIISKDTLKPENIYKSVTVIAKDCSFCDAFSTAIFNLDPETAMKYVSECDDVYVMFIDIDGNKAVTPGFDRFLK